MKPRRDCSMRCAGIRRRRSRLPAAPLNMSRRARGERLLRRETGRRNPVLTHLRQYPDYGRPIRLMAQDRDACGFTADAQRILRHCARGRRDKAETGAAWPATYQTSSRERPDGSPTRQRRVRPGAHPRPVRGQPVFKAAVEVQVRPEQGEARLRSVLAAYPASAYAWVSLLPAQDRRPFARLSPPTARLRIDRLRNACGVLPTEAARDLFVRSRK